MIGAGLIKALGSLGKGALGAVQGFVSKLNPITKLKHSVLGNSIGKLLISAVRNLLEGSGDLVDIGAAKDIKTATKILTEINDIKAAGMIYSQIAPNDMIPNLAILEKPLRQPGLYKTIVKFPMGMSPEGEREWGYYSKYMDEIGTSEDMIQEVYDYVNDKYQPDGDREDYELAMVYHKEGYPHRQKQY